MKKAICKILILCVILSMLLVSFSSCGKIFRREYDGKKIIAIEKTSINYMGGTTYSQWVHFETGSVSSSNYSPNPEECYENRFDYSFDPELSDDIINEFYNIGILNLRDEYKPLMPVMDGGGWTLTITYADGTTKVSRGSNAGPYKKFEKAGLAFYQMTGIFFLDTPDRKYYDAPQLRFDIHKYGDDAVHTFAGGIDPCLARWNGRNTLLREENYKYISMQEGYKYSLYIVDDELFRRPFKSVEIKAYDKNGNNPEVEFTVKRSWDSTTGFSKTIQITLEPDRYYVLYIEFKDGTAQYRFFTESAKVVVD